MAEDEEELEVTLVEEDEAKVGRSGNATKMATTVGEANLMHLENTVSEEIAIIEHVRHEHQHQNHTAAQLITRAEELVKKAKAEVAAHPHSRDTRQLEHEVAVVERLVKALQATPAPTGEQLRHEEQALARAEQALNGLIERLHHQEPHHNGGGH
ncbi:hypothetical protein TYRP_016341 [Tyrophagus putrescentiae]|nr:hypothetical protein TYRP_016341 [Tyrophagus putrescentiae]